MTEDRVQAARHFGVDPSRVHIDNVTYKTFVRLHDITPEEFSQLAPKCDDQYHLSRLKPGEALRLDCRTNDTWDALFALYQKGSLDAETIVELVGEPSGLSLDEDQFNGVLHKMYTNVAKTLEASDVAKKMAEQLGLDFTKPEDAGSNVYSPDLSTDFLDFLELHRCPMCKGAGWTALFMFRSDCELCESRGEIAGVKMREYKERDEDLPS